MRGLTIDNAKQRFEFVCDSLRVEEEHRLSSLRKNSPAAFAGWSELERKHSYRF